MSDSLIDLICDKCGCNYQKPEIFKQYLVATNNNVFYKWSLLYCDKCRIERQNEALKSLPNIIKVLSEK